MNPLLHSLQIGSLATWLSVSGFGIVGIIIAERKPTADALPKVGETQWLTEQITLGQESRTEPETQSAGLPSAADRIVALPSPPQIQALTALGPLPEVPDLTPAPRKKPMPTAKPGTRAAPASRQGTSPTRKPTTGTGISSASRLAAGNMNPPSYPAEARRRGQTGTVVVEFTVDGNGRVISASAKSPSPWPLLNNEAVRTVRRWKFPPGPVTTYQRPIVFRLR